MADVKISELPVGTALTGTEEIPMAQSGATVKMTAQDIADLASPTAGVSSVVAGSGISVDNTDPANPIISATGGGGGIPDAPSDGNLYGRKDGDWEQVTGGGGADSYTIITEGSAFTAEPGTHDGLARYIRAGGDVTFDNSEPYTTGMVFNIRATAGIDLVQNGVTLTPPAGGTLELSAGMAVQVVMTGAAAADVIGQTVQL